MGGLTINRNRLSKSRQCRYKLVKKRESLLKNLLLDTKDTLPLTTEIFRFNTQFKGFNMNILYTIIILYVHFTYSVHDRIWQNTDTLKGGRTRDGI